MSGLEIKRGRDRIFDGPIPNEPSPPYPSRQCSAVQSRVINNTPVCLLSYHTMPYRPVVLHRHISNSPRGRKCDAILRVIAKAKERNTDELPGRYLGSGPAQLAWPPSPPTSV